MMYPSKLLKCREVAELLGVSQSAIYKWVSEGNFPKPIKFGDASAKRSSSRWDADELSQWIEDRRDG